MLLGDMAFLSGRLWPDGWMNEGLWPFSEEQQKWGHVKTLTSASVAVALVFSAYVYYMH